MENAWLWTLRVNKESSARRCVLAFVTVQHIRHTNSISIYEYSKHNS